MKAMMNKYSFIIAVLLISYSNISLSKGDTGYVHFPKKDKPEYWKCTDGDFTVIFDVHELDGSYMRNGKIIKADITDINGKKHKLRKKHFDKFMCVKYKKEIKRKYRYTPPLYIIDENRVLYG